jgi:hypothetical protein
MLQPLTALTLAQSAWAGNTVNTAIFRHHGVLSRGRYQFCAFYLDQTRMRVVRRRLGDDRIDIHDIEGLYALADAHHSISLGIDPQGFLHLAWACHSSPIHYRRSERPFEISAWSAEMALSGRHESRVTYPTFLIPRDGGPLLFLYRDGRSGDGTARLKRYVEHQRTWTDLPNPVLTGSGHHPWTSSPYWNRPAFDLEGNLHLSFVWRTRSVGRERRVNNIGIGYARSPDAGSLWFSSRGQPLATPITQVNAETVFAVAPASNLINQTGMAVDSRCQPHIVFYADDPDGILQYQHVRLDGRVWRHEFVSRRTQPFSLAGDGTLQIPISRPEVLIDRADRVYLIYRGDLSADRMVAQRLLPPDYRPDPAQVRTLWDEPLGFSEPVIDMQRWLRDEVLSILVQRNHQPAHDRGEGLRPGTPVHLLDIDLVNGWEGRSGAPGHNTLILFLAHQWQRSQASRFLRLYRQTQGIAECRLLLQDDGGPVRAAWEQWLRDEGIDSPIEFFDPGGLEAELGYPMLYGDRIVPGSTHYPLLSVARRVRREYYWVIESDVEFSGSWAEFLAPFSASTADLLASHLLRRDQQPRWAWWDSLRTPESVEDGGVTRYRAFFPVHRMSSRALAVVDTAHRTGWAGHYETLVPTVLMRDGLEVRDLRDVSDCYAGTHQDPVAGESTLSSMRYRPYVTLHEQAVAMDSARLLHPVKSGISVVMATCNGERFLARQFESLERQSRRPNQVVVIDDRSDDGTLELIGRFAARGNLQVDTLRQYERVGYSANFIAGTALVTGDLVLFCDQDDIWHPDKIAVMERAAQRGAGDVFSHDIETISDDNRRRLPSLYGHLESIGLGPWACIKGHTLALRRSFLLRWGPPPAGWFSYDLWFTLLAMLTERREYIPQILVTHRLHGGNASGWIPGLDDLWALRPGEIAEGVSAAEVMLDLCVKNQVEARVEILVQTLSSRLAHSDPALLARALDMLRRHRHRAGRRAGD